MANASGYFISFLAISSTLIATSSTIVEVGNMNLFLKAIRIDHTYLVIRNLKECFKSILAFLKMAFHSPYLSLDIFNVVTHLFDFLFYRHGYFLSTTSLTKVFLMIIFDSLLDSILVNLQNPPLSTNCEKISSTFSLTVMFSLPFNVVLITVFMFLILDYFQIYGNLQLRVGHLVLPNFFGLS